MTNPAAQTAAPVEIECTEQENREILTGCQAAIFRDIWRLKDADTAFRIFCILQRALPADLDRSDTPNLNTLANRLREAHDIMHYLESHIRKPSTGFALLRFQAEYNQRAAENRASKAADGAAAQPQQKGGKQA